MSVADESTAPECGEDLDPESRERPAQVRIQIDGLLVRWSRGGMDEVRLTADERWALIDFLEGITRLDAESKERLGCGVRQAFDRSRAGPPDSDAGQGAPAAAPGAARETGDG